MGTDLTKFDRTKLMDGIKDRIKSEFVQMIPDEYWKEMVKKVVDDFFNEKDSWGNRQTSQFQNLVGTLLYDDLKKRIGAYLNGPEWEDRLTESGFSPPEAISKAIRDSLPEMARLICLDVFRNCVSFMKSNMTR